MFVPLKTNFVDVAPSAVDEYCGNRNVLEYTFTTKQKTNQFKDEQKEKEQL